MARRPPQFRRLDDPAWLLTAPSSRPAGRRLSAGRGPTVLFEPAAANSNPNPFARPRTAFVGRRHSNWLRREMQVNVVLDVGANVGQYARKLRRGGYRGRSVSFEPVAELSARLQKKAASDDRWQVHGYALGEE